jgi:hypothetical protein
MVMVCGKYIIYHTCFKVAVSKFFWCLCVWDSFNNNSPLNLSTVVETNLTAENHYHSFAVTVLIQVA